jgi:DNA-binding response OmpR family regulator
MLTASGETIEWVVGLEIGADDDLAKPFDPRELLARIRSVLRRVAMSWQAAPLLERGIEAQTASSSSARVPFGRCLIDLEARQVFEADGTEVPITAMQFDLMEAFLNHPNRVLSRDRLLELARLRRKIEENPERPQTIKTVHGMGHVYVPKAG